jgi:hypothetical protein
MRRDHEYWQRLRKDLRSNWAAGLAAIAALAATVSLIAVLVKGTHYQARGNPLYWVLMLPGAWWVNRLAAFEPRAVRWWRPFLLLSVVVAAAALIATARADRRPAAVAFFITLLAAGASLGLRRNSLVEREGPAR